ncbi:Kiwa anti-phage protein KwaB-like domain-containing protein [Phenylobacterium kunshanense]|nr:Kiwa anti-phage protein KwaB-like domain-containing protein [Phenylobacterium kunshanense]
MDIALTERLADAARQSLSEIEARATDADALAEFDFDAMVEGSIGVLNVRETPGLAEWLEALPRPDWPVVFDGSEETLGRSRFYAFRLALPDGRTVRAFRGKAGLEIAARKRNAVSAAFRRDTLQMVPIEGAVITFDQTVDFFEWDGLVFVLNIRTFESVTNIREVTIRKAVQAVDALAARFDLGDVDALKTHVEQRTRLGKRLAAAHKHGLVGDINAPEVTNLIAARGLRFTCVADDGGVRFGLDHADPRSVEDFVDLVSDVFLVSPTTRRDWEALAKRPPRRR